MTCVHVFRARAAALVILAALATSLLAEPASAARSGGPREAVSGLVQWSVASGGNGHLYGLSPRSTTNLDDAIALAAPGYVVSVLSEAEKEFLVQTFGSAEEFRIGYTDRDQEGTWTWVSGEPSSGYEFWASGEPNNSGPGGMAENVGIMNHNSPGAWNDVPDGGAPMFEYRAIFEYEPAVLALPDARIRRGSGTPVGNDVYNTTGLDQTRTGAAARGGRVTYVVSVQNDAPFSEPLRVRGQGSTRQFGVVYRDPAGVNVTNQVTAGTYATPNLLPGAIHQIRVAVTVRDAAPRTASLARTLTARSTTAPTIRDTVKFVTRRS